MEIKIKYQSKGKTPAGDPFMTIKQARGYYEYAERGGKDSIFFILIDKNFKNTGETKYCLINESKPPLDERFKKEASLTTAFGGSIDMDKSLKEICKIEVLEEAGYEVELERIKEVGKTFVSTQMSQFAYGFLVDVTGIPKTYKAEWEDEKFTDYTVWLSKEEVFKNDDWKSIYIISKNEFKGV